MRGKKFKKLLTWILCVCLLIGMIPSSAFAADTQQQSSSTSASQEEKSEEATTESSENSNTESTKEQKETKDTTTEEKTTQSSTTEAKKKKQKTSDKVATQSSTGNNAEISAVKLVDKDGLWGHGIITGSEDLDDKCWDKTTDKDRGYDNSSSNDIIRSFDSISYNVSTTIMMDGAAHKLKYEVTLPDDDELTLDETAMNADKISDPVRENGKKTYTCEYSLQANYAGGEKEINIIVKVGNKHQGDTVTPEIKAYLDNNANDAKKVENMKTVTVTTAPMYNIVLKQKASNSPSRNTYNFDQKNTDDTTYYPENAAAYTDKKVTGYEKIYGFALEIKKNGKGGIKGVEFPDPKKGFKFDIDLSDATLAGKSMVDAGFTPLLYYVAKNQKGGNAVTNIPFTDATDDDKGCYDSGNVTMKQDGTTLHVTVKDFKIDRTKFPKKNEANESYWQDINKILEGNFSAYEFNVIYPYINENDENLQTKIGDGTVNVRAEVLENTMEAYSENDSTNKVTKETTYEDNYQTSSWPLSSGGKREQQIYYSKRDVWTNEYTDGSKWNDKDIAAAGVKDLGFTVAYNESELGDDYPIENVPVAINQLVLFDRNALDDVTFHNATTNTGYSCTPLYAVYEGGRLNNEDMRTADLSKFKFYKEKPEGGCDGVLFQYRGANTGKADLQLLAQCFANVKADVETDKVYMITAITDSWTVKDFESEILAGTGKSSLSELTHQEISDWVKTQDAIKFIEGKTHTPPTIDPRGTDEHGEYKYTVPTYKNRVYNVGKDHKFSVNYADGLYIVPYTTTVTKTVAQLDENGDPYKRYNVSKGQRFADYKISSAIKYGDNVTPPDDATTTVYLEDTLPKGLTYIKGSANWGGDYTSKFPQAGSVAGGKQIEPEVTEKEDGTTILKWTIKNVKLQNGALPTLYYSCKIGDELHPDQDIEDNANLKNTVTIQTDEDKRPINEKINNIDSTAISIVKEKEFYIVKRGGDSLELQDNSSYELIAANTSDHAKEDLWMFDTLPYKNDGKSKKMDGTYQIESLTMDQEAIRDANDIEVWYTNKEEYIGKTAKDITSPETTITEANGWKKAEESRNGKTITFSGEGLIGAWPTAIVYKDAKLENNTVAALTLKYKAVAGAKGDEFTNTWSTMSNNTEIPSSVTTDVYNRTIEGTVWVDQNKDGKIDSDETKLEGVKVTLYVKNDKDEYVPYESYNETVDGKTYKSPYTVETDKDGHYEFSALPPGDYQVKFESSDGTDLGKYDVTEPNADKDTTKTSKVEKENAKKENGELKSGTIEDIEMPSLDQMVADKERNGTSYNLPDQNLGLVIPTTDISVTKKWEDKNNQDEKRPDEVKITLSADGQEKDTLTIKPDKDGNWKGTFSNLPKYDMSDPKQPKDITYTIKEDTVDGYTSSISGNATDGYVVTNKHETKVVSVSGSKKWEDKNDQDEVRPDKITINLLANDKKVASKAVTESDDWKYEFTNLPEYENGTKIVYTITEDPVEGYNATIDGNNVTNTHNPETVNIPVSKVWNDKDDQDSIRPTSVVVQLLADGQPVVGKTMTLIANTDWKGTFTDLPKKAEGKDITYTIAEVKVDGYTSVITGDATKGYDVTNNHTPETTKVSGSKTWDDHDNQDGVRPDKITINLLADGTKVDSKEVTADDNWSWDFDNLAKYKEGKEIEYTVTEDQVTGYTSKVNGYDVTNSYTPKTTEVSGSKTWKDNNDQDGKRPEKITINLLANGTKVDSKEVTANDNWSWKFTDLPKKAEGKDIKYTVTEDQVTGYTSEVKGYDVTNSHTPEKTKISGSKTWKDNDNQDGVRAESITIRLLANGKEVAIKKVTADDNWSWDFKDLDKYEEGKEIVYTVTEDTVTDYTSEVNGYDVTNTHNPGKTSVSVTKAWEDGSDQDGLRPESIKVHLYADGKDTGKELTLTAKDNWSGSFTDLDAKKDGKNIEYTVKEESVKGYTSEVTGDEATGYVVTNKHTPEVTEVSGSKTWKDNDDQDGLRPEKITIHLYADGVEVAKQEATAKDNWSWKFTDLPKKAEGKDIKYTVTEDQVTGYTSEVKGYDVTNSHTPEKTEISGSKTWKDNDNQDGVRAESITIRLLANGKEVATKKVTADDNWSWDFKDLDKYEEGKEIVYTVTEDTVTDYTSEVNGYDVTNTHNPGKTSVSVTKAWEDGSDQDGLRPESIKVHLYADGKDTGKELTLTAKDNWSGSFTDLDAKKAGKDIEYTVKEESVKGYTSEVTGDEATGYVVTNKHTPEATEVSGSKTWKDNDDQDGLRPEKITIHLYADGVEVAKKEVTVKDNWSWKFDDLAKYKEGKEIKYTVKEDTVEGYTSEVKGYDVTNSHTPEKAEISGSKTWKDSDNQDGVRPESITIRLLANGKEVATKKVTADDNWSWDFKDLDKYEEGKEIVYTVTEDTVTDYTSEVNGYDVTNTHNPGKTSVSVTKAWEDGSDQDGLRPESIKVHLYADGKDTGKELTLTAKDNWSGSFTDLDAKKDGKDIEYTVKEENVKGYTSEVTGDETTGYVVTNKHTPEVTEVSGSKTWKDNDDQDGLRPEEITIRLLANGVEVANKEVTEDDDWSWKFKNLAKYEAGKEIVYTITEDAVADYTTTVNGYNVTNIYKPGKTSVTVTKSWNDKNNKYKKRTKTVTVHLYADGEDTGKELTLNKANNWSGSFTNLDQYNAGMEIEYTIKEDKVSKYKSKIIGDSEEGYVVINTYTPEGPDDPYDENPKDENNNREDENYSENSKDSSSNRSNEKKNKKSAGTNNSVKTGDTNAVLPWMLVCGASLGAIFITTYRRKKSQK